MNLSTQKPATGCGADDRYVEIIRKPYETTSAVNGLVSALMDTAYDANLSYVPFEKLQDHCTDWDPKIVLATISDRSAIEVLDSPEGVPNGGHRESMIIFNFVTNTTLDRDSFVAETNKQVFVVDVWYLQKMANSLGGKTAAQTQNLFQAMVTYQVATYLTLCDGSQRIVFAK